MDIPKPLWRLPRRRMMQAACGGLTAWRSSRSAASGLSFEVPKQAPRDIVVGKPPAEKKR